MNNNSGKLQIAAFFNAKADAIGPGGARGEAADWNTRMGLHHDDHHGFHSSSDDGSPTGSPKVTHAFPKQGSDAKLKGFDKKYLSDDESSDDGKGDPEVRRKEYANTLSMTKSKLETEQNEKAQKKAEEEGRDGGLVRFFGGGRNAEAARKEELEKAVEDHKPRTHQANRSMLKSSAMFEFKKQWKPKPHQHHHHDN